MLLLIKQNNQIPPDATFITPHSWALLCLVWTNIWSLSFLWDTGHSLLHWPIIRVNWNIVHHQWFITINWLYFNWVMMITVLMWLVQLISTIPLFQHVPPHAAAVNKCQFISSTSWRDSLPSNNHQTRLRDWILSV